RRDTRRAHDFGTPKHLGVDPQTGETHLYHRAHVHEGNLFYKGKMIVEGFTVK
ncbi:MAG: hypothetical protein RL045_629, partial [Bacteroidota bacterium]